MWKAGRLDYSRPKEEGRRMKEEEKELLGSALFAFCLLPSAFCLLPSAFCLLPCSPQPIP
jgi:hypothetical protein